MDIRIKNQLNFNLPEDTGTCPHLGAKTDSTVCFGFASPNNYCYHASPPAAVQLAHQESTCLTAGCADCPVFQSNGRSPLPEELRLPTQFPLRRVLNGVALALLVGALAFALWVFIPRLFPDGIHLNLQPINSPQVVAPVQENLSVVPQTGDPSPTSAPSSDIPLILSPVSPPTSPAVFEPAPTLAQAAPAQVATPTSPMPTMVPPTPTDKAKTCYMPAGWIVYKVQSGDSLSLLSRLTGSSLAEIRDANCLTKTSLIKIGQHLYLPRYPVYSYSSSSGSSSTSPNRSSDPLPPPSR